MSPQASVSLVPASSNSEQILAELPISEAVVPPPSTVDIAADAIDRSFHAALARFTGGVSPAALALAFADWRLHLLASPGKQAGLAGQAIQNALQFFDAMAPKHAMFQPWSAIRPSTRFRRLTAVFGFRRGVYVEGAFGSAASMAPSASVSWLTCLPKRSRLAASTPFIPLPR